MNPNDPQVVAAGTNASPIQSIGLKIPGRPILGLVSAVNCEKNRSKGNFQWCNARCQLKTNEKLSQTCVDFQHQRNPRFDRIQPRAPSLAKRGTKQKSWRELIAIFGKSGVDGQPKEVMVPRQSTARSGPLLRGPLGEPSPEASDEIFAAGDPR